MTESDHVVGRVVKAQGLRGEIYIVLRVEASSQSAPWIEQLKKFKLYLPVAGAAREQVLTLEVEKLRLHKEGLVIQTKEIRDRTSAERLRGAQFAVPERLLTAKPGETPYLREILNFTVFYAGEGPESAPQKTEMGRVVGFSFNGVQDLLVIDTGKGCTEIPFVREFVVDMDFNGHTILLQCPLEFLNPQFWQS